MTFRALPDDHAAAIVQHGDIPRRCNSSVVAVYLPVGYTMIVRAGGLIALNQVQTYITRQLKVSES